MTFGRENLSPTFVEPASESAVTVIDTVRPDVESSNREVKIAETIRPEDIKKSNEQDDDVNKIPLEYADQSVSNDDILGDKFNRVSEDFKIPQALKPRVKFWFDIYTKYTSRFP